MKATVAPCPECDEALDFGQTKPKIGLKLTCPYCETNLAVISLDPLKLEWDGSDFYDDEAGIDEDW